MPRTTKIPLQGYGMAAISKIWPSQPRNILRLYKYSSKRENTRTKYRGDLNTRLVWYSNGQKFPITWWSVLQMPLEYRTKFCPVFRPPFEYLTVMRMVVWILNYHLNTGHLNTGQVKVRYSDVSVIQMLPLFRSPLYLHFVLRLKSWDDIGAWTKVQHLTIFDEPVACPHRQSHEGVVKRSALVYLEKRLVYSQVC